MADYDDALEILEVEDYEVILHTKEKEYEEIVNIDAEDELSLATLIEEERKLRALINENIRQQREIERSRYNRRAEIRDKERQKQAADLKLQEAIRNRKMEADKADAFTEMVRYCREQNFEWVDKAHPHQWEGAMTIAHYGSTILGDETGLGKTITAIISLDMAKHKKVLVITPNDVVTDFAEAIMMYAPHRNILPIEGSTPAMRRMVAPILSNSSEFTVVTNYESLWKDSSWLGHIEWDVMLIDEAHNIKNDQGLTFGALDAFTYKNCVPITATSILNSPKDMFTSLHLIDPETFDDSYYFLNAYCEQLDNGKWVFKPGGEKALMHNMKGRIIKRTFEEAGVYLPKQTVQEVLIPVNRVPEEQFTIMSQIKNYAEIELETGEHTSINAMIAVITRERQAAVYPAGIEIKVTEKMLLDNPALPPVGTVIFKVPDNIPSIKLDMAEDKLERVVKSGKRCVVFSQFKTALTDLERRLNARGIRVVRFDGDTNKATRLEVKRDFLRPASGERKSEYKYEVVLANYKTGGVGLNFTDATYMLCLDEEWNPAKNRQAWARIHRLGQSEETTVDILRIEKAIDMWMKTLNEQKQAIVEGFESEINMIESLKDYFANAAVEAVSPQKAITVSKEYEVDDDFMSLLDGME